MFRHAPVRLLHIVDRHVLEKAGDRVEPWTTARVHLRKADAAAGALARRTARGEKDEADPGPQTRRVRRPHSSGCGVACSGGTGD
jgi:hypothetical protein